jgi:CubicO group peptidase (beta-lactamase class C family)
VAGRSLGQGGDGLPALSPIARAIAADIGAPGAAVAVVAGGNVVVAEGVGRSNVESGVPVTPDTLFLLGSVTKTFTAVATATAAERGLLDLDRPVGHYVRGLPPCVAAATLRQLLSHTGGLIDEPDEHGPHDEAALAGYPRGWTDEYCLVPPGTAFSYSNPGYALVGLTLQEATGRPYADAMDDLVFRPLGMTATTFRPSVAMTFPIAAGHLVVDGRASVMRPMADDSRFRPAGQMFSSARDLARFASALVSAGDAASGRAAIPVHALSEITHRQADIPSLGQRYGLGLALDSYRGLERVGHDGSMPGFAAAIAAVPSSRTAVVLLANRDGARLEAGVDRLLDAVLFGGKAAPPERVKQGAAPALETGEAGRMTGSFTNPRRWTLDILSKPEGLALRQFGRETPLKKIADRRFITEVPAGQIPRAVIVNPGPDGKAATVQFALWTFARVAPGRQAAGRRADVDAAVAAFLARRKIPSAAVAVVLNGSTVLAAGYGEADLEHQTPATESTVYEIGSITKQFTAEAIMLLVEEGKVGLDVPAGRYLSGLPPAWAGITVRHLLSHQSGLHDWETMPEFSYRREYTPDEFIALLAKAPLDFTPGSRWAYTNSGYPLLGLIVERVSGRPFEQFVDERVFKPAGMTQARFKHPEDIVPRRAAGFVDRDGVLYRGEPLRPRVISPNGGILASAADMGRWIIALESGAILKSATVQAMTAPVRQNDGSSFSAGLSWFIDSFRGRRVLLHNGSTVAGFSSVVYWFPDDRLSVTVLMNIDRWNAVNTIATKIAGMFVPGLSIMSLPESPEPDPGMTARLLGFLDDVAGGRASRLLAASLRNPDGSSRANRSFGFAGKPDRFAFLDREDFGPEGRERFGNTIRWIYRYKLVAGSRTVYYTFDMTPEGTIARFYPEEE